MYCLPDMITRQDVFNAELVSLNTYSTPQRTLVRLNIPLFAAVFQFLDHRLGFIHPPVKAKPHLSTTAMMPIGIMIGNTLCLFFPNLSLTLVFKVTNQKLENIQLTHLNLNLQRTFSEKSISSVTEVNMRQDVHGI